MSEINGEVLISLLLAAFELFRFGNVFDGDIRADTAPGGPFGAEGHPAWFHGGDEVIENLIRDALIECAVIAVLLKVEFETLEFETGGVGDVGDDQGSEIGVAGHGTDTGEFGADRFDDEIPIGIRVIEGLDDVWGGILGSTGRLAHNRSLFNAEESLGEVVEF